jgi:hypothetical protein
MALSGKVGAFFVQSEDPPIVFVHESTTPNSGRTVYTLDELTLRYWDKSAMITVYVNGTPVSSGFVIQPLGGSVVFDQPRQAQDDVTVSGKAIAVEQAGGFFSWSVELSLESIDYTTFASQGWKEHLPAGKGFTASAERYWADERLSARLGQEVIVAFYVDTGANTKRYEGYGILSSDQIEVSVDDVVGESLSFEGVGSLIYREE